MIFLAFLAVVLGNVNADRKLDLDAARFEQDLQWASGLAIIYWLQSLLTRTAVIDPKARWDVNVGYNTRELTILAVSVLVAGMVVVVRQANDLPSSGWTVLGPLFAFRFLYDVWSALQAAKPPLSDSANPSRRRESRPPARSVSKCPMLHVGTNRAGACRYGMRQLVGLWQRPSVFLGRVSLTAAVSMAAITRGQSGLPLPLPAPEAFVATDGLTVLLQAVPQSVRVDERPTFAVRFENRGSRQFHLYPACLLSWSNRSRRHAPQWPRALRRIPKLVASR